MLAAASDPRTDVQAPVPYDDRWVWLAVAAVLAVVAYYALVWWTTRPGRRGRGGPHDGLGGMAEEVRRVHLDRLDRLARRVDGGLLPIREAHQEASAVLRSYVASVSPLPATTMTLSALRDRVRRDHGDDPGESGPDELVAVLELMYLPEFAPASEGRAEERWPEALRRTRRLVREWGLRSA